MRRSASAAPRDSRSDGAAREKFLTEGDFLTDAALASIAAKVSTLGEGQTFRIAVVDENIRPTTFAAVVGKVCSRFGLRVVDTDVMVTGECAPEKASLADPFGSTEPDERLFVVSSSVSQDAAAACGGGTVRKSQSTGGPSLSEMSVAKSLSASGEEEAHSMSEDAPAPARRGSDGGHAPSCDYYYHGRERTVTVCVDGRPVSRRMYGLLGCTLAKRGDA